MNDVRRRLIRSVECERAAALAEFERDGIEVHTGTVSFADAHTVFVLGAHGTLCLEADRFLIAAGTRPARCWQLPCDGRRVFNTDEVLQIEHVPRSLIVIGGSAHGVAHAMLFAGLGTQVTVVDGGDDIAGTPEMARSLHVSVRLGAEAVGVEFLEQDEVVVLLKNGKRLIAESVLFATGRVGDTADLNLEVAGLRPDERGRLWCNDHLQTWVPHIYGAGDVVGFPRQRGTVQEQAVRAMRHAFGDDISTGRSHAREKARLAPAASEAEGLDAPAGDLVTV